MTVSCSADGCTNRFNLKSKRLQNEAESEKKLTFHRFPKKPEKRALWVAAVRRQDWQPSKYSVLCSEHFTEESFDRTSLSYVRLRENAVPSIFPAFPSYLQKKTRKRENSRKITNPCISESAAYSLDRFPQPSTSNCEETSVSVPFPSPDPSTSCQEQESDKKSKSIGKRKSSLTKCATRTRKRRRKYEILEGPDIPGQSNTCADKTLFEIQSKDEEFIQGQQVMASVSTVSPKKLIQNPRILKRKTLSNSKKKQNQSTDINTSDVQAKKRSLGEKNAVASRNLPSSSKRQPVKPSNSKVSSINSPSTRVQNPQILKHKSSSNRNIQKNKNIDYVDDEFDIFAKDIAFQLKQLPYYNALQCQEKIKRIINQERFIAQQSRHQEIETIIIKKEPGLNEQEPLQPVSSQGTIQTIIKDELVISEDEYPHPVSGHETIQTIIYHMPTPLSSPLPDIKTDNMISDTQSVTSSIESVLNLESAISEKELSRQVSGQETIINKKTAIREEKISHQVSGQETIQTIIKEEPVISEDEYPHPVSGRETMINKKLAI